MFRKNCERAIDLLGPDPQFMIPTRGHRDRGGVIIYGFHTFLKHSSIGDMGRLMNNIADGKTVRMIKEK